jgi:hypothetical protein
MATPRYTEAVVTLVDILGFREILKHKSPKTVLNYLSRKDSFHTRRWSSSRVGFRSHSFSDLIVTCLPLQKKIVSRGSLFRVYEEVLRIGCNQARLAISGVFVRGGLTIGPVYSSPKHVFGPALVTAYDVERSIAKWPVIAVDCYVTNILLESIPECLNQVKPNYNFVRDGPSELHIIAMIFSQLRQALDRTYFIDYLSCLAYEDQTTGDLLYYLKDHKKTLVKALSDTPNKKLYFVARYHNSSSKYYYPDLQDLLIPGFGVPPRPGWPSALRAGFETLGFHAPALA